MGSLSLELFDFFDTLADALQKNGTTTNTPSTYRPRLENYYETLD